MAKSSAVPPGLSRKTVVLAWLDRAWHHSAMFNPRWTDFGIVLPAGVPLTSIQGPLALDRDHGWSDWHAHPNLMGHDVWDPTNWKEPDGSSFFGWRFENRDENLDRWLMATFMWDAPAANTPDTVLGTILTGGNPGQSADIALLPGNNAATVTTRRLTGDYGATPPPELNLQKVDVSRWRLSAWGLNSGFAAKISGPHLTLTTADHKKGPEVNRGEIFESKFHEKIKFPSE